MNVLGFFRGSTIVARQELISNLKSIRLLIMVAILALAVVGGAYGLSGGAGGGPSMPPLAVWTHPAYAPNGSHLAVAWVSDPFGRPQQDLSVEFNSVPVPPVSGELLGRVQSNAAGFARLDVGNRTEVEVTAISGTVRVSARLDFFPTGVNFSFAANQADLDDDGVYGEVGVHVLTAAGEPAPANLSVNGTFVKAVDARGYGLVDLPPGFSDLGIEVAGESVSRPVFVGVDSAGLFGTPDATLFILSAVFLYLIVPIFAIVVTFDAVSKERVHGTLDLLLSRPVSRTGVLIGKFLGAFGAVAIPVTLVNLVGIAVLTATSGEAPTGGFAAAFLGLTLLLIVFYILLQLIFSTLAKTSGTAILFGVLVWLLFNILYGVLTLVIGVIFFPDPASQFQFQTYAGLGNPSSIYQQLIFLFAPPGFGFFGGTTLSAGVLAAAAAAWVMTLLVLALWTFQKKAAV